jgi:uncharacterized iron-regulated membrane protein
MVTCFTGALLVFQEEIEQATHKSRYFVKADGARLPITTLTGNLKQKAGEIKIVNARVYTSHERSVEITYRINKKKAKGGQKAKGEGKKQKPEDNLRAYVNPYTGAIIELVEPKKTFFYKVLFLHRWLLANETGKLIVGISTSVFLFILITGIILWWPANKNILKQRLTIKRTAGWKRTNHDWHIVFGFYCAIFLFIFAFTGLAWSFKWFNEGIYALMGSPVKNPEPPASMMASGKKEGIADVALSVAAAEYTNAVYYQVNFPKDDSGAMVVNVLDINAKHKTATDAIYIDQYSGEKISGLKFENRSKGARVRSYFLPIHTGAVLGMPTRIIAFIATLLGTTFPVTGIIMWWNRTRKKKRA